MLTIDSIIQVTVKQTLLAQQVLNVWHYRMLNTPSSTITEFGDAWWLDLKATWRAMYGSGTPWLTTSIVFEDLTGDLDFYELVVPIAEQDGTRTVSTASLPSFNAVSVKLQPINRQVRPGGKRFATVCEEDSNEQALGSTLVGLTEAFMDDVIAQLDFGIANVDSAQVGVYGFGRPRVEPIHFVDTLTYVISPYVSSQVSRKIGRGA